MIVFAIVLAFVAGGAWRRWWGGARPSWAPSVGYRAMQAVAGVLVLVLLSRMAGDSWVLSTLRAGAVGFLALPIAISRAWVERPWLWIERHYGTPRWPPWFDGWTTYAEATAGALVFAAAMVIR